MKRQTAIAACAIGGVAALAIGGPKLLSSDRALADDQPTETAAPSYDLDSVVKRDLTEERSANGSVGFGKISTLPIEASGLVTKAVERNTILTSGDVLVRIANKPVFVADGEQPLYRDLRRVGNGETDAAGDKIGYLKGDDVTQLQQFLIDQGFDDKGRLSADGTFGLSTERAVKAWQRDVGHTATGVVDRTQIVFVDGSVRVESAPEVGQPFSEITVTSTAPTVTISVTSKTRSFFEAGTEVAVESGSASTKGTVTSLKRTVGQDGSPSYEVEIEISGDELGDAESVKVISTKIVAGEVLSVPVSALIALAEGGWAVQVDDGSGPKLTAVTLNQVVDGFAAIEGVDEGTEVVVPA